MERVAWKNKRSYHDNNELRNVGHDYIIIIKYNVMDTDFSPSGFCDYHLITHGLECLPKFLV